VNALHFKYNFDIGGMRKRLCLLWEIICPYEIRWGIEEETARRCGPLELPKEGSGILTTSQGNQPPMTRLFQRDRSLTRRPSSH
jgi:hypothetical protein